MLTRFLELARSDPSREMLAVLEESQHPVLSMYARLEQVARERASR